MTDHSALAQEPFRAVLHPHRSLSPQGFLILMSAVGAVSFITGMVFLAIGAWPVLGFFGLDVLLIYVAFKLNYRSGKAHEIVELSPDLLRITQVAATGLSSFEDFNPYWARVRLAHMPDGHTDLKISSHGRDFSFGKLLNDEERKDFAQALETALTAARSSTSARPDPAV